MTPDVYAGENMDEHEPAWNGYAVGDMGDETFKEPIVFEAEDYPPGTRVIVESPICPKCHEVYENCMARGGSFPCDFDWRNWVEEQYS